jgi:hypothetical protein
MQYSNVVAVDKDFYFSVIAFSILQVISNFLVFSLLFGRLHLIAVSVDAGICEDNIPAINIRKPISLQPD